MKVAVGCGKRFYGKDWLHIDGGQYDHLDGSDIYLQKLNDNTVDLVYASHLIAYFDREEVIKLFRAWYRVLKPTGILRLATPDLATMFKVYDSTEKRFSITDLHGPIYGVMKMRDCDIQHKTGYNFRDLEKILKVAEFKFIYRYNWRRTEHANIDDHSQAYLPKMDKENGILISLNVEAKKEVFYTNASKGIIKHGMAGTGTYSSWQAMLGRCRKDKSYIDKGIKIEDERWYEFINFFNDMGERPSWGSIDRINNNKGYYSGNCRWSDSQQQNSNKSNNRFIEYLNESKTLTQWARKYNLHPKIVAGRLYKSGWSIHDALTTPIIKDCDRSKCKLKCETKK